MKNIFKISKEIIHDYVLINWYLECSLVHNITNSHYVHEIHNIKDNKVEIIIDKFAQKQQK